MLRIIHTADVHIGAKFAAFGKKARAQRQALLDAFEKTVDTAISAKANIVLVAGDLFDSNFPSYQSVHFVKQQLRRLNAEKIYAAILPGTHDCLAKDSVYRREDFAFDLPYAHVFREDASVKEFTEINLALFAKANAANKSTESPIAFLAGAAKNTQAKYKVAMAHGSVQIEGKAAKDDMPITFSEIADSGMDYIAFGHWHGAQEYSLGKTTAWYAGSPEITYQEGKGGLGQGYILQVDITDAVAVKPVRITTKEVKEVRMDMQVYENAENIKHELSKLANQNLILVADIFGFAGDSAAGLVDAEKLEGELGDAFFSIRVNNNTVSVLPENATLSYPEELVIGQFVRGMQAKLKLAKDDQEKKMIQDALQIGIAELEGKNVLE